MFETQKQLQLFIREHAAKQFSQLIDTDKELIEKFIITQSYEGSGISINMLNYRIFEMPGLDNYKETNGIKQFIMRWENSILPIFIVDMTSGTIELEHY